MHKSLRWAARFLSLVMAATLAANPVLADKPEWAGKGKGKDRDDDRRERVEHRQDNRRDNDNDQGNRERRQLSPRQGVYFADRQKVFVRDYYGHEYGRGSCPPGLAKKNNGCMPPGQAKKWQIGRALPREVVYYDVPPTLSVQIGVPPSGYRYVRVAADILLIAVGTGMVIDAIQDLGR